MSESVVTGKHVRVTVEVSTKFISALRGQLTLHDSFNLDKEATPADTLARMVCQEARGDLVEKIDAMAGDWPGDIKIIHDERRVV